MRAGSADEYISLLPTNGAIVQRCPELAQNLTAERVQAAHESVRRQIAQCSEKVDWAKAVLVERVVPHEERATNMCSAHEIDDIYFYVEVGAESFAIKLDDPLRIGDVYFFAGKPRCRLESPEQRERRLERSQ